MSRYDWVDVLANTPEGIAAGERAGGRALVMDNKLPLRGLHSPETRAALEALGFQFGEETGGKSTDTGASMYIECRLPEGWKKGADLDDPYGRGSYLFDPQGRKRASMFTKETSYDRYASISFMRRYTVKEEYINSLGCEVEYNAATHRRYVLADAGKTFKTCGTYARDDYQASEALGKEAREQLLKTYPDADDPFAYWGD